MPYAYAKLIAVIQAGTHEYACQRADDYNEAGYEAYTLNCPEDLPAVHAHCYAGTKHFQRWADWALTPADYDEIPF